MFNKYPHHNHHRRLFMLTTKQVVITPMPIFIRTPPTQRACLSGSTSLMRLPKLEPFQCPQKLAEPEIDESFSKMLCSFCKVQFEGSMRFLCSGISRLYGEFQGVQKRCAPCGFPAISFEYGEMWITPNRKICFQPWL